MTPSAPPNRFLERMLERLYASLATGSSLNCRPHNSRQRVDLVQLSRLEGTQAPAMLSALLGEAAGLQLTVPRSSAAGADPEAAEAEAQAREALLRKLATIVEDARTFEQDTGAHALHVGYPLLQLPPDKAKGGRRILAPVAFIPVRLTLKRGRVQAVQLQGAGEGVDRVLPNMALLAWVEQQTGAHLPDLFADETGEEPWRELNALCEAVCRALQLPVPAPFVPGSPVQPTPRADEPAGQAPGVLPCAVLGLYPLSNQSLLPDLEAITEENAAGVRAQGPLERFLRASAALEAGTQPAGDVPETPEAGHRAADDRLIAPADPCQARAVRLARSSHGLVVHGPPGTGKSQTIANTIGDHLARGERVLFVCDKRTALDVVKHRLDALGLGSLCAVVHDAQRDQRELYLGIREQLDTLTEAPLQPAAAAQLARVDAELQEVHDALDTCARALGDAPSPGAPSFHELVGRWLAQEEPAEELRRACAGLEALRLHEVESRERALREVLERGQKEGYAHNPWRTALGVGLQPYLATPLATFRERLAQAAEAAREADELAKLGFRAIKLRIGHPRLEDDLAAARAVRKAIP
ncbi:MAG TPA: DUF4011 domain-containing protein, partial [Aggregicoccus sp.]|nr:DUF4011 domain-containing protein [Aggregicoccus sp.]